MTPRVVINGILNLNKPYGMTSMEAVRRVKRASGQRRVGHGGTLDPVATGVVPICFGQATRVMEYLVSGAKEYEAVIELGVVTNTYDVMGEVVDRGDASGVSAEDIEDALTPFRGVIKQVPPMFSALKRQGKRLYDLARAGIEVEREPRSVEVYSAKLLDWTPPLATVAVGCGRGFYMRSLAHDLGAALGCGGSLKELVRLRSGQFRIESALDLDDAERIFVEGTWRDVVHTADAVLTSLPAAVLGSRLEDTITHGQALPHGSRIPAAQPDERCRAYSIDGRFLAVLVFEGSSGQWRPDKVFDAGVARPAGVAQTP